jgi:hypothetical protein
MEDMLATGIRACSCSEIQGRPRHPFYLAYVFIYVYLCLVIEAFKLPHDRWFSAAVNPAL